MLADIMHAKYSLIWIIRVSALISAYNNCKKVCAYFKVCAKKPAPTVVMLDSLHIQIVDAADKLK